MSKANAPGCLKCRIGRCADVHHHLLMRLHSSPRPRFTPHPPCSPSDRPSSARAPVRKHIPFQQQKTLTYADISVTATTSLPCVLTPPSCGASSSMRSRASIVSHASAPSRAMYPPESVVAALPTEAPTDEEYDAIIIGSGMGGLATASQMVTRGAKVLVLEKYLLPGGSSGHFKREGYTFDVGSSMMFGFGEQGTTNFITKCLHAVGKQMETVPDPTQVHYHLPKSSQFPEGLHVQVFRQYEGFVDELTKRFPHESEGIRGFYNECWSVFRALNSIELKSLEEPRYLMQQFANSPLSCLKLAATLPLNTGAVARRFISDPELLRFIDMECFTYSTVKADSTPMVTSGMVMCDRHYGGVRYPRGGIGRIAQTVAEGLVQHGGRIVYKANVKEITMETREDGQQRAVGVRLADGRRFRSRTVISNASRWDTFEGMIGDDRLPEGEKLFRKRYKKAPSFFSLHMGVRADVLPPGTDCHHIVLEDWSRMEDAHGTLFVSMPSLLDPSLAPEGRHIVHAFTPDWIDAWQGLTPEEYERKKVKVADELCQRLEALFPGIAEAICFREIATPRTHRRYLSRPEGTYGPIPSRAPLGVVTMPLNSLQISDRISRHHPSNSTDIPGLYCVGDSTFPGQGVNAVVFSGFGCAHRALCDLGMVPSWPLVDGGFRALLRMAREAASRIGMTAEEQESARVPRVDRTTEAEAAAAAAASQQLLIEARHREVADDKDWQRRKRLQSRIAYPYDLAFAAIASITPFDAARKMLERS